MATGHLADRTHDRMTTSSAAGHRAVARMGRQEGPSASTLVTVAALAWHVVDRATRHFESLLRLDAQGDWCLQLQSRARQVIEAARTDVAAAVEAQVALARERLALPPAQALCWAAGDA